MEENQLTSEVYTVDERLNSIKELIDDIYDKTRNVRYFINWEWVLFDWQEPRDWIMSKLDIIQEKLKHISIIQNWNISYLKKWSFQFWDENLKTK
jgi:hypothetical protein